MELPAIEIIESDIDLSNFARAISMPIRVSIIRILQKEDFGVNQDFFVNYAKSPVAIGRHLYDLKRIGILKSQIINRKVYYSLNKEVFQRMAKDFNAFFITVE